MFQDKHNGQNVEADESSVREASQGDESKLRSEDESKEIKTMEDMKFRKVVPRPTYEKIIHTKCLLKHRKDEQRNVCKHNASLVVCFNEETDCQKDTPLPVAKRFIIKLICS